MAKITYRDRDKSCPVTSWMGVEFKDGVAVDLDQQKGLTDEQKASMLELAQGNRSFEVDGVAKKEEDADAAGYAAAKKGEKRDTSKGGVWLLAFDRAMAELEEEAAKSKNKAPRR